MDNSVNEFNRQRDAQDIDLKQVEQFLQTQGYEVVQIAQQWRHVISTVQKDGQKYFFKMATSEGVAPKTRNEYVWDKTYNELKVKSPLKVPNVHDQGEWQGLFWFMTDFVDGHVLIERRQADNLEPLEQYFERIVQGAEAIMNLPSDIPLPSRSELPLEERKAKFLEGIKYWMSQFPQDVSELYRFIENNSDAYLFAPAHGDFVPWHMLVDKDDQLTLIDGEHSKPDSIKFYDIAYFYHRIFTGLKRPDIADKFLRTYLNLHPMTPAEKLCFMVILAQRTIGGYFDANVDKTEIAIHDELAKRVLGDKIIPIE
jgi:hypothetical protein